MNERRTFAYFQRHLRKDAERADVDALFESDYATIAPVFEAFLERLLRTGFECRSLDRFGLEPEDGPAFYFRYDVHIHDLPAAYALARLHEEHAVPGVFYITWAFSDREVPWTPYFELLKRFDPRHVAFGLHCAPTTTWLVNARFDGDFQRARQHAQGDGFVGEMLELARTQEKSDEQTPALRQMFLGGGEELERIHVGFQESFGRWRTVTGHGNFLSRSFFQALRLHPELKVLTRYFSPVDFLIAFGVDKLGYAFEATRNPAIDGQVCRMAFDGHPELAQRVANFLDDGQSFAITFHPSRWLHGAFRSLIAPVDAVSGAPAIMSESARSYEDQRASFDFSRLIFIAGFARGGTTWFRRALSQHPQVTEIPVEINFHRERPLNREKVAELLLDALPADLPPGGHVAIKGPVNSLVFGEIARLLPEARMVYIVRDPRDVLNSHRRGHQQWMKGRNETVEGCMAKTQRYFEGFLTAEGRPNVHLLQYERLHQRFPEVYAALCRFAGIADDPATIEACMHSASFQALTGRDHADEDPDSGARKGLVGDWVNYLTEADEDWLRARPFWRSFFDRFGYRWEKPSVAGLAEACRHAGMPAASVAGEVGLSTILVLESPSAEARSRLDTARIRLEGLGAAPVVALDERLAGEGGAADLGAPLVRLKARDTDGRPRFRLAGGLPADEGADPLRGSGVLEDDSGILRSFDLPRAVDALEPFAALGGRSLALVSTPERHPVDAPLALAFRTAFAA